MITKGTRVRALPSGLGGEVIDEMGDLFMVEWDDCTHSLESVTEEGETWELSK